MPQTASHPFGTTREDVRIPLPDGTRLAARLWRPVTDEPVPALLEYQAGGIGDRTALRDAERHPWYAGHGYASLRLDSRGHGNSEGAPTDPASDAGLADAVAVLDWLAARPWCTGRIGAFGLEHGGTAALALAALAPPPLAAVVAVCASDDRGPAARTAGGAPLAAAVHRAAAGALATACRPPDPRHTGDDWRRLWLERLAALEPPGAPAPAATVRPEDVRAAVLAVGGWADPYPETVLHLVERATAPVRGIVGPWPHEYPDQGRTPGPAIGFLQETLRWWEHWLRDVDTGVLKEPALRTWMNESVPPATAYANRPGRWIGDEDWPSPDVREIHYGLDDALRTAGTPSGERYVPVRSPQHTGVDGGSVRPAGRPADLPPDQRAEDGRSVCFDSAPLPEPAEVLGTASVRLRLRDGGRPAQVAARLCDVAPDGTSTLVCRGAAPVAGGAREVEFTLTAVAHAFPAGHRIRLALSSAYWPWLWPAADPSGYELDPGASALTLPVRHLAADAGSAPISFDPPEHDEGPATTRAEPLTARPERLVVHDVAAGEWRLELAVGDGPLLHPDGLVTDEHLLEAYRIRTDDPLSATARTDRTLRMERTDIGWDVTVQLRSETGCDAGHLVRHDHVRALEGGDVVFERDWHRRLPRPV